eukprot:gene1738-33148_t
MPPCVLPLLSLCSILPPPTTSPCVLYSGAPYYVSEPVAVGTTFNFTIVQDASGCTDFQPKAGGPPSSCCQMSIDKIEMVINPECRGEIKSISVNGQARSSSYSNSSNINMPEFTPVGHPDPQPWYQVFKITQLGSFSGDLDISIQFKTPDCRAAGTLFPNNLMWYAFFSGQQYRSNCCGTSSLPVDWVPNTLPKPPFSCKALKTPDSCRITHPPSQWACCFS